MSDQEQPNFSAIDLPITLYLNQRLTFDLLAILQGGFSSFSTIQTTSSGETTTNVDGKAQLGVSNVFAFLGINLSAQGSRQQERQRAKTKQKKLSIPRHLFLPDSEKSFRIANWCVSCRPYQLLRMFTQATLWNSRQLFEGIP